MGERGPEEDDIEDEKERMRSRYKWPDKKLKTQAWP